VLALIHRCADVDPVSDAAVTLARRLRCNTDQRTRFLRAEQVATPATTMGVGARRMRKAGARDPCRLLRISRAAPCSRAAALPGEEKPARRAPCRTLVRVQTEREASRVDLARLARRGVGWSWLLLVERLDPPSRKQLDGARQARSPECSGLGWCHTGGWHTNVWTHVKPARDDSVDERPRGVAEGANDAGDRQ
jgi:hypothetical protein